MVTLKFIVLTLGFFNFHDVTSTFGEMLQAYSAPEVFSFAHDGGNEKLDLGNPGTDPVLVFC